MSPTVVSICVPAFNAEHVIGRCLEAILRQDLNGCEILVVDNRSTDGTVKEAAMALGGVPQARILSNETNLGRVENWNRCLEVAEGNYVKFVMASDVLWRGSLRLLLDQATSQPGTVIVSSRHQFWDGQDQDVPTAQSPSRVERYVGTAAMEYVRAGGNPFWALNGALIARPPTLQHRVRFDPTVPYFADLDFCVRLSLFGLTMHLETATYWFNAGVKSRFHFAGLVPEPYFQELRRVQQGIEQSLRTLGKTPEPVEEGLLKTLRCCLDQGTLSLNPFRAARLFESRRYQLRAAVLAATEVIGLRAALGRLRNRAGRHLPRVLSVLRWARARLVSGRARR